jgi:hypothetical protein
MKLSKYFFQISCLGISSAVCLSCAKDNQNKTGTQQAFTGISDLVFVDPKDKTPYVDVKASMAATLDAMEQAAQACAQGKFSGTALPDNRNCQPYECAMKLSRDTAVWGVDFKLGASLSPVSNASGAKSLEVIFTPPSQGTEEFLQCVDVSTSAVFYQKAIDAVSRRLSELLVEGNKFNSFQEALSSTRVNIAERIARCVTTGASYRDCIRTAAAGGANTDEIPENKKQIISEYKSIFLNKVSDYCKKTRPANTCPIETPCRLERLESFIATAPALKIGLSYKDFNGVSQFGVNFCTAGSAQICTGVSTGAGSQVTIQVKQEIGGVPERKSGSTIDCVKAEDHPIFSEFAAFLESSHKYIR